jgi:hypothetical protein
MGFICLKIGSSGVLLWTWWLTFRFHKRWRIFRPVEWLPFSQKRFCPMKLLNNVWWKVYIIILFILQFSPSCYFQYIGFKHSICVLPLGWKVKFHNIQKNRKNYSFLWPETFLEVIFWKSFHYYHSFALNILNVACWLEFSIIRHGQWVG